MPFQFLIQSNYGEAAEAVLNSELARYLAALLRVANVHEVSVSERNVAAATAYILADEQVRQEAFRYSAELPPTWEELLGPLRLPGVAAALFRDACQVAWSDGELDEEEREVLQQVGAALGLEPEVQSRILEGVQALEMARRQILEILSQDSAR